ncbi:MAG: hypothetical protein RhofKO_23380 [Rhodothermales bacterium]
MRRLLAFHIGQAYFPNYVLLSTLIDMRYASLLIAVVFLAACAEDTPAPEPAPTATIENTEVDLLADATLSNWRSYKADAVSPGWTLEDGVLIFTPGEGNGGDIMTREQYADFDLTFEFNVSPEGNSGIIYRVVEDYDASWQSGPEYQVIDDDGYPAELLPAQKTGSNYDLEPPRTDVFTAPGEWQSGRIKIEDGTVQHYLNGEMVVEYTLGSEEWTAQRDASKFIDYPGYGASERGYIAFQDHGNPVSYRNIRIRSLD